MKTLLTVVAMVACASGCGGEDVRDSMGEDDTGGTDEVAEARLSIVGDDDLFGGAGDVNALVVRYHDQNDEPLAGVVYFSISGDAGDSELSRRSVATDLHGMALVDLTLDGETDTAFEVTAEAADAQPVRWRISYNATPVDPTGDYAVSSDFRLPGDPPRQDLPGLALLAEAVDDPFDPATWLLDGMESSLDPALAGLLAVSRSGGALDATLNDLLAFDSPAFYSRMYSLDHRARALSRGFGLTSRLRIDEADGDAFSAEHVLAGWVYELDGETYAFSAADLAMDLDAATADVVVQSSRVLIIDTHRLAIPYGDALSFGLDAVVAPSIDAWSTDLASMLTRAVDCASFGDQVADRVGVGPSELYEIACVNALLDRAAAVHATLRGVDATLSLRGVLEDFETGTWTGDLAFPSDTLELDDQEFTAERD